MKHDPLQRLFRSAAQAAPASFPEMPPGFELRLLAEMKSGETRPIESAWGSLTPMLRWVLGTAVAAIVVGGTLAVLEIRKESTYDMAAVPDTIVAFGYSR